MRKRDVNSWTGSEEGTSSVFCMSPMNFTFMIVGSASKLWAAEETLGHKDVYIDYSKTPISIWWLASYDSFSRIRDIFFIDSFR